MTESPETGQERDRIIDSAERLFAALGYDGTSAEMIADSAGAGPGALAALGGRSGVYLLVMERFFQEQNAMLDEIERVYTPDRKGIRLYFDHILDFYLDHPEGTAIWKHRRLSDAADFQGLEERFLAPVYRRSLDLLGPEAVGHPDFEMASMVISYCIYGFVQGGLLPYDGNDPGPGGAEAREKFRSRMHRLQDLLFQDGFMRNTVGAGPAEDRRR